MNEHRPPVQMRLTRAGYGDPDVTLLVERVQEEYVERYGSPDESPIDPVLFEPPHGSFFVGYLADDVPVALRMESASGTKTVAALAPGATTSHAFTTRAASVPAAEVVVTATAVLDGEPVTTTVRAPHPAASCG